MSTPTLIDVKIGCFTTHNDFNKHIYMSTCILWFSSKNAAILGKATSMYTDLRKLIGANLA